ncbi:MAG: ABC transporter ATP-binding protein [Clostridiales Family XIII bacterium]|jgi:NitT/TauT family transport system ATP-binding protein|nr:ABC transporter ATP-binding protein [Clostridiales Family XIII bacterium]
MAATAAATIGEEYRIVTESLGLVYNIRRARKDPGSRSLQALKDVNLRVRSGEFLSLVGPSGCGKSTFLYILAGLNRKTSGVAYINGQEITGPALDRGIIMQAYALFPWRTIQKNVEFGLEVKKLPRKERARIAGDFIELVGLSDFADRYPYELSGGMKQRIAIARALAYDPDVLLMDEPFAAVDEQTRGNLQSELLRIWSKTNKTVIFVTHSIEEAVYLSDRVAVMTASPGTVRGIVDVDLPRPRDESIKNTPEFAAIRNKVWPLLQSASDRTEEVVYEVRELVSKPQDRVI